MGNISYNRYLFYLGFCILLYLKYIKITQLKTIDDDNDEEEPIIESKEDNEILQLNHRPVTKLSEERWKK